jgi:hypothetical protein
VEMAVATVAAGWVEMAVATVVADWVEMAVATAAAGLEEAVAWRPTARGVRGWLCDASVSSRQGGTRRRRVAPSAEQQFTIQVWGWVPLGVGTEWPYAALTVLQKLLVGSVLFTMQVGSLGLQPMSTPSSPASPTHCEHARASLSEQPRLWNQPN